MRDDSYEIYGDNGVSYMFFISAGKIIHLNVIPDFLSQIYNWKPEVYNTTENLPAKMPQYIKSSIAGEQLKPKDVI